MIKKKLITILLAAVLLLSVAVAVQAAGGYTVSLAAAEGINVISAKPGDTVTLLLSAANNPGINQHPDYLDGYYPYESQKEAIKVWNTGVEGAKAHVLPPLTYTGEEASERSVVFASARDNLDAAISNIILGKQSIDTYDAAIKAAKDAGYDRVIEITQNAYERYLKVIEESK